MCVCSTPSSQALFPFLPLSPLSHVSAWEQSQTMVTKSQRAITRGGTTAVCGITGLRFISSACFWVSCELWVFLESSLTIGHCGKTWWRYAPMRLLKWEVRTEIGEVQKWSHQQQLLKEQGGLQLYNVLFWYCITRKGWEYPGKEIIPRKPFPSSWVVRAKQNPDCNLDGRQISILTRKSWQSRAPHSSGPLGK